MGLIGPGAAAAGPVVAPESEGLGAGWHGRDAPHGRAALARLAMSRRAPRHGPQRGPALLRPRHPYQPITDIFNQDQRETARPTRPLAQKRT